jgi:hypothetical protein
MEAPPDWPSRDLRRHAVDGAKHSSHCGRRDFSKQWPDFGTKLSEDGRWALIEYLKTL